ncbi:Hypothetical predicted protein [Cloeon dipterum]|uniref:C2H2-type domain-containing protein n=1 Tax=Cloeon dipterum TaxID=197152 RepID=A0A8S1D5A0_9INSE|nr:Hypothetical predicted protein [Cloeon dipterum]
MRNSTSLRCHVWSHSKGKQLQCQHCSKAFGARVFLSAHIRAKHLRLERAYACTLCSVRAFRGIRGLVLHYARKHLPRRQRHADLDYLCCYARLNVMRCGACGKRFINKAQLVEHEAMHTGVKRYSCKKCGRAFKTGSLVRRHEIAHHGRPSNFVCRHCGRQLASTQELTLHEAAHESVKAFQCHDCSQHYKHKESLMAHIRQQHLGMARTYVCAACGYHTTKRSRYETHVLLHEPRPLPCEKCDEVLPDEYSHRKHVDWHRPYPCDRCEKRFDAKHNLNMHMRVHEGGQSFTCGVCGRTLMSSTRLRIHMRYHTGEEPRQCTLCPASFKEITPLKTHMRKVHNVKPYACEHCNNRFDFVRDMRAHVKSEH